MGINKQNLSSAGVPSIQLPRCLSLTSRGSSLAVSGLFLGGLSLSRELGYTQYLSLVWGLINVGSQSGMTLGRK